MDRRQFLAGSTAATAALSVREALGDRDSGATSVKLPQAKGSHDICFVLTRTASDPLWAIDSVELEH